VGHRFDSLITRQPLSCIDNDELKGQNIEQNIKLLIQLSRANLVTSDAKFIKN
jgi:hypothetical protein